MTTSLIGRIVVAIIIAVIVGLLLVGLLGPVLVSLKVPIAVTVGSFFVDWGWVIGVLCGLWHFFTNGAWTRLP